MRGDVDGLRAVAIVLVVLFHAGVPGFAAGYIGVDVFFVISGYLITRNLVRDTVATQRLGLIGFWARRLRRLVPAQAVVIVATLAASLIVLPRFMLAATATQGAAAALYVSNLLFARQSRDYFAADVETSPFLHTWSLGVEEQFYIFWPLLFAVAAFAARRWWPDRFRQVLIVGFAITLVGSMACNLVLIDQSPTDAFYTLRSRAWEFAAAGLLATVASDDLVRRRRMATALGVAGSVLLVASMVVIPTDAAYPGVWAVLPVTATLALILAGTSRDDGRANPVSTALSIAPAQWVGRLSYSWYLWHWPAMVLTAAWYVDDSVALRTAAGAVSLGVAWVAHGLVENPVRFSPRLIDSLPRTYALAAIATVAVVGLAVLVHTLPDRTDPKSLEGRLIAADRSHDHDGCAERQRVAGVPVCINGAPEASATVLVLGDSHARHWKPALDAYGRSSHIRIVEDLRMACPAIGVAVTDADGDADTRSRCAEAWGSRLSLIEQLQPDAVLIAQWAGYEDRVITGGRRGSDALAIWEEALREAIDAITAQDATVAVVLDGPTLEANPLLCISRKGGTEACRVPRHEALEVTGALREAELAVLADHPEVERLDLVEVLCDEQSCAVGYGDAIVYSDTNHLAAGFVTAQQGLIADLLDTALTR